MLLLELLDGKEGIRGKKVVGSDGVATEMFSVYDFINVVCGRNLKAEYGHRLYYSLIEKGSEYKDEIPNLVSYLNFLTRRERNIPCMSIHGLQRLLMILGGKAEYRALVETTFTRVMAGDRTLIKVIEAPMQQACREALAPGDHVLDEMALNRKRWNEQLEYEERVEALELKRAERIMECMKNQVVIYHIVKLSCKLFWLT